MRRSPGNTFSNRRFISKLTLWWLPNVPRCACWNACAVTRWCEFARCIGNELFRPGTPHHGHADIFIHPSKDPFLPLRIAAMRLTLPQVRFNSGTIDKERLEKA